MNSTQEVVKYFFNFFYAHQKLYNRSPRHPLDGRPGPTQLSGDPAKKPVGRPKGEPSPIVNVRLPLTLVAQLDRYLDRLERHTGLKANRAMIARRPLELFLASHCAKDATAREG